MTSCGVVMWRMDGYIDADKETEGGQCQINVTLWIVWNDGSDQKCEGTVQKGRTSRGVVIGVLRMGDCKNEEWHIGCLNFFPKK